MAKAKKTIILPKGFREISGGGSHDWDKNPTLEGVLVRKETVTVNKGKKDEAEKNVYTIKDKAGEEHRVWQSAGLKALEDVKKGKKVFIAFAGTLPPAKKGQNGMRKFVVAVA